MDGRFQREIWRLEDGNQYGLEFQTRWMVEMVRDLGVIEEGRRMYVRHRLETQARFTDRKSVYVAMKWLIFLHQVIQISAELEVLELVQSLLDMMTSPHFSQKFQSYLHNKLFCPYKQYLKKLAGRKINTLDRDDQTLSIDYQSYSQYNFINYAITEFAKPIRQFTPYLKHQYPCLNKYIQLIGKDLLPQYKRVIHAFEENLLQKVTFIEIENIGNKLLLFKIGESSQKALEATADNSHSSKENKLNSPLKHKPISITPFQCLQSSNLSLNFFNKE